LQKHLEAKEATMSNSGTPLAAIVTFGLLMCGCTTIHDIAVVTRPLQVYGAEPDRQLACTLLRAAQCSYAIAEAGRFSDESGDLSSCLADWTNKSAIADSSGINAVLIMLTDRSVIIAYRGTLAPEPGISDKKVIEDWVENADRGLMPELGIPGLAHHGFLTAVKSTWEPILSKLREWKDKRLLDGKPIYVTGHSKGGAAASISAVMLAAAGFRPAAIYTYASARPGDSDFLKGVEDLNIPVWRYENRYDVVPHLPPTSAEGKLIARLIDKDVRERPGYFSVGNLLYINWVGLITASYPGLAEERLVRFGEKLQQEAVLKVVVEAHSSRRTGQYDQAICPGS
jgi:hypothetical protein